MRLALGLFRDWQPAELLNSGCEGLSVPRLESLMPSTTDNLYSGTFVNLPAGGGGLRPHPSIRSERESSRPRALFNFEALASGAMLFYTTGAIVPLLTSSPDQTAPTSGQPPTPLALAIKLVIYLVAMIAVARRLPAVLEQARRIKWILAPVLIAFISVVWTQDAPLTLRSVAVLAGTTVFGIYFGIRYTVQQQLQLLSRVFFLLIVLSIIFALFLPQLGIDYGSVAGDWRGVFLEKNGLGQLMVLSFFVFLLSRTQKHSSIRWIGMGASLALLVLSRSATGVVVCVAMLVALPLYRLARARFTLAIPILMLGSMLLACLALIGERHSAGVFALVGRNSTLTGRTELWKAVWSAIAVHPWLGYGFSAFWRSWHGQSGLVLEAAGWNAGYAHNGFLDLILQLGVVGLASYLFGYVLLCKRAVGLLRRSQSPALKWLCSLLLFMLIYNLTEGSILGQDSIVWLLYISAAVAILSPMMAGLVPREAKNEPE